MDNDKRKDKLKESLIIASKLAALTASTEYIQHLRPHLLKLSTAFPVSPDKYATEEEYVFALKQNNMRAIVYSEIVGFLDSQESVMKKIRSELEKPPVSYGI